MQARFQNSIAVLAVMAAIALLAVTLVVPRKSILLIETSAGELIPPEHPIVVVPRVNRGALRGYDIQPCSAFQDLFAAPSTIGNDKARYITGLLASPWQLRQRAS